MKKRFTFTLTPELVKQVKIHAIENDIKVSALIEKLLREWVKEKDHESLQRNE